jgi:hypothetical protein
MPALTPAEEKISPSSTYMASGSTSIAGCARARVRACCQCVVARRPSSSPAAARMNAPVQMDAVRRARLARTRAASASS